MRISTQCDEYVCRLDVKVGFDTAGEFYDHHNGDVLDWSQKITGTDNETTRTEKSGVPIRGCKSKKPSTARVIHTNAFNRSQRNQVRLRVVTRDNTAEVSAPEHHVSVWVQNDAEGSYASTCVMRCILPCLARERCAGRASEGLQIER